MADLNLKTFDEEFRGWSQRRYDEMLAYMDLFLELCESPIEQQLLAAMLFMEVPFIEKHPVVARSIAAIDRASASYPHTPFLAIVPQAEVGRFRLDFLIVAKFSSEAAHQRLFAVECDGHDFHEKTKQQAARDKSRDRALLIEGIPMLRFTGSEIFAGAGNCADEIGHMIFEAWRKAIGE